MEQINDLSIQYCDDDEDLLFEKSLYYSMESFAQTASSFNHNQIPIFFANARSLVKHINEFKTLFEHFKTKADFQFTIMSFVETWLNDELQSMAQMLGYQLVTKHKG